MKRMQNSRYPGTVFLDWPRGNEIREDHKQGDLIIEDKRV